MNTNDALLEIVAILQTFHVHEKCIEDFASLLRRDLSGQADRFLKVLTLQLKNLSDFGRTIINIDDHEKLKYSDCDIYSIHLQQKRFNIRLLVAFDRSDIPCLLTVFYERSGKRKTGYTTYLPIAEKRFHDLEQEN